MSSEHIKWVVTHGEVEIETVWNIEKMLGVKFPEDYIHCARVNNGGHPSNDIYDVDSRGEIVFNRLLSFHEEKPSFIVDVYHDIKDRLVDGLGLVPFANDPFGNHLCFDYRNIKENPTIVFWDHELAFVNSGNGIFPICSTFTELLSKLYTE